MSRILAIDYGKKRTGVAVTDVLQIIANGLTTVPTHQLLDFILKYVEKEPVERRAMAVASEQEMKAKAQEARAKVIEAEAEVPKAMAEAFRNGNLGIMDYYRMKNIEADTSMRETIAKPSGNNSNQPLSK